MFKWDFAISYADEEVGIASDLAELLKREEVKVFFAKNEKVYLWGKKLKREFSNIFGAHTHFAVILLSSNYVEKFWTQYEFDAASRERGNRDYEFILPIIIDEVRFERLNDDVQYIDLRKEGLLGTAGIMMQKLRAGHMRSRVRAPTEWVAAFGVNTDDLIEGDELPAAAPRYYPYLCDWLEDDMRCRLAKAGMTGLQYLEDSRTGETFSLRFGFEWNPDKEALDLGDVGWWEVLEVAPMEDVYPGQRRIRS